MICRLFLGTLTEYLSFQFYVCFSDLSSNAVLWTGSNIWLEVLIVAVIFTICVIIFLIGCLDCCRNSRFSFKVNLIFMYNLFKFNKY